jgi:four helix bundle protein
VDKIEFKKRTKLFSLRVIELFESLPNGKTGAVLGKQLLRSGTSVGANYRSACWANSKSDFIYKMNIVEEEADETIYWLELLNEAEIIKLESAKNLIEEANQLLTMTTASIKTAKGR